MDRWYPSFKSWQTQREQALQHLQKLFASTCVNYRTEPSHYWIFVTDGEHEFGYEMQLSDVMSLAEDKVPDMVAHLVLLAKKDTAN